MLDLTCGWYKTVMVREETSVTVLEAPVVKG